MSKARSRVFRPVKPQKFHREVQRIIRDRYGVRVDVVSSGGGNGHVKWQIGDRVISAPSSPSDCRAVVTAVRHLVRALNLDGRNFA